MTAGDIKIRTGDHGVNSAMSGIVVNGVDDYLQINALGAYEAGANNTKGTISAWVNVPDVTNTYCVFSIGLSTDVSHYSFMIKAGKPQFYAITAGVLKLDVSATTSTLIPHKWHHVCLVQDGQMPKIYLDGVRCDLTETDVTTKGYWGNTLATWDRGAIGITQTNGTTINDFKGGISYVKYSSGTADTAAWTDAQVLAEYQYKKGLASAGTDSNLCFWPLDGDAVEDQTGGGTYDGTISSDVQYDPEYSQLTSKLRLLAPVVADDICLLSTGGEGYIAAVVKAA